MYLPLQPSMTSLSYHSLKTGDLIPWVTSPGQVSGRYEVNTLGAAGPWPPFSAIPGHGQVVTGLQRRVWRGQTPAPLLVLLAGCL